MSKNTVKKSIWKAELIGAVKRGNGNSAIERVRIIKEYIHPDFKKLLSQLLFRIQRPLTSIVYVGYQLLGHIKIKKIAWGKLGILALFLYVMFFQLNNGNDNIAASVVSATTSTNAAQVEKNALMPAFVKDINNEAARNYIRDYGKIAVAEMHQYGIPASIKMGQALIESRAGRSKLARESNNHFGIKCRKKCRGCTCRNYNDDDIYDMFRVFKEGKESWREHSLLLAGNARYTKLQKYGKNYKKWATGLKNAGYATDKKYDSKLINVINKYKLYKLDEM